MNTRSTEIKKFFEDQKFASDIYDMYTANDVDQNVKNTIDDILANTPISTLLRKLLEASEHEVYAVNIPLSDCFFIISELSQTTDKERDFALDMSVYLSEDIDSRDASFEPKESFSHI